METKIKTFDCVEMKNRIQKKIIDEYEAEKDNWPSYIDFVKARNAKSEFSCRIRNRISQARHKSVS